MDIMKSKRIIIPAITAFFLLAAIGSWEVFMKNRLAYGAIIGGLELGGLSISQAEKILNEKGRIKQEKLDEKMIIKQEKIQEGLDLIRKWKLK